MPATLSGIANSRKFRTRTSRLPPDHALEELRLLVVRPWIVEPVFVHGRGAILRLRRGAGVLRCLRLRLG